MEFLNALLGRGDYLPHGYCFTWTPGLLWSMVGADGIIALAYFSIPVALMSFVRKGGHATTNVVLWLFIAFIFACGTTHLMDIWTIWQPDYALQALTKIVTAAISLVTAIALWPLIPHALKIPSAGRLQSVIGELEAQVKQRRGVEEQLADIEQNLALTLSSIGAGFIATDRAGHVTRMNSVAEHVTGWTQSDAQGQSLWVVLHREGRPAAMVAMNPVDVLVEQGPEGNAARQITAIARDGTRTVLEVKAAATRAPDGTLRGIAMVFQDFSALHTAQAEAQRLAAIVESSNDAIISYTLDGQITSWNSGAHAMFGYTAQEAIGQPVGMLVPPERYAEQVGMLANLALGAQLAPFETLRCTKEGTPLEVSVRNSPIRDAQGRVIGASKIARDVSQQRRAEAALRSSEARLRFTLDSTQIGAWELDLATGLTTRSLQHDRCFGYGSAEPQWSYEKFLDHVHPHDRAGVVQSFHTALNELHDWRFQCRVIWPDTSVHWISAHASLQPQGKQPPRLLGIITDITQQKLAEVAQLKARQLEAQNREILEASRLKSQFLANMSHELRTPLNAIIGFADLLSAGAVLPQSPKFAQFLGHIASSGRHLLQLINDVLDLSKVESGKFEFFAEPVNLPQLVKEVGDILHTEVQRKHLHLVADIAPELTDLLLDPARLKQVLYNYLSNAIKFTPEDGHVTVTARAHGDEHVCIEVADTGIGIAPGDVARLFTEFQQLDAGFNKQHAGTGLGLALTRRLVEAQGGSVGVHSEPGKGSVFHLLLNRIHGTDARRAAAAAGRRADDAGPSQWATVL